MGDTFKRQLQMDGNLDAISMITTKSDELSTSEIVRTLHLEDKVEPLDEKLNAASKLKRQHERAATTHKREYGSITKTIDKAEAQYDKLDELLSDKEAGRSIVKRVKSKKRKSNSSRRSTKSKKSKVIEISDTDEEEQSEVASVEESEAQGSDESDFEASGSEDEGASELEVLDAMSVDDFKAHLKAKKATIKELKDRRRDIREKENKAKSDMYDAQEEEDQLLKQKRKICALARNEYTKLALQEDFRTGLRTMDEEIREEEDGDQFDPDNVTRDYDSISLPVFCC
jgi:chromosome segregation ATPase